MTSYTAEQWREAFKNLEGGFWDDAEGDVETALAEVYRHDNGDCNEDNVLAVIEACAKSWAMWEPVDTMKMTEAFLSYYGSMDDALDEHLREQYNGFPLEDVKENASVRREVFSESDLVVELGTGGIYVFRNPGSVIDQMLDRARLLTDPPTPPVERTPE